jgi:hypothetical protein
MSFTVFLISFLAGVSASLGLGGGMFLIVYLTVFAGISQTEAQGINLIFFIPLSTAALWLHARNGLVEWKKILPAVLSGALSAAFFSFAANNANPVWTRRFFGVFVLLAGMKFLSEKRK